jgi:hypothetical protein
MPIYEIARHILEPEPKCKLNCSLPLGNRSFHIVLQWIREEWYMSLRSVVELNPNTSTRVDVLPLS